MSAEDSHLDRFPVAVDAVIFGVSAATLQVLLIQRGIEPYRGAWALPGGFLRTGETLEQAVARELAEEAGVRPDPLVPLRAFSSPGRDPRGPVIAVAFVGLVRVEDHAPSADTDAAAAAWFPFASLPVLAFDHATIIADGHDRLLQLARSEPVGLHLLPSAFGLGQLQTLYEAIGGRPLDKRNFRRKALATGLLVDTGETLRGVAHRAPRLYRFDVEAFATRGGGLLF